MPDTGFAAPEATTRPARNAQPAIDTARSSAPVRRKPAALVVGNADDTAEREADRVADEVISRLQGEHDTAVTTQAAPSAAAAPTVGDAAGIGRAFEDSAVADAAAAPTAAGGPVVGLAGGALPADVSERIDRARSGGSPLPDPIRARMESAFGGSLAGVRVHRDPEAAQLNRMVSARAFTTGQDIFFGAGEYQPHTPGGERVLAHELAHTQQQSGVQRIHRLREGLPDWNKGTAPDVSGEKGEKASTGEKLLSAGEGVQGGTGAPGEFASANSYREDVSKAGGGTADNATGRAGNDTARDNVGYASSSMAAFDLALSASSAIMVFIDKEAKGLDKAAAALALSSSITASSSAMGDIASKAMDAKDGSKTDVADKVLGEIAGIVGAVTAGFGVIKTIVELISKAEELEDGEKASKSMEVIKGALETGKGVVETINKFMDHLGHLVTGMVQAIPGLSIAMAVIDWIMQGINIGYSWIAHNEMRADKGKIKDKFKGKGYVEKKTFWGGRSSFKEQATTNVAKGEESIKAKRAELATAQASLKTAEAELVAAGDERMRLIRRAGAQGRSAPEKKIAELMRTEQRLAKKVASAGEKVAAAGQAVSDSVAVVADSQDYLLSRNLQKIASKRIKRGALNISTSLPSVAGDIAILSGAGAAVGAGLKAASSGSKLLAIGVRMGKQLYHNVKGDEKSETNKLANYHEMITGIIGHVVKANESGDPDHKKQALREVNASGLPLATMNRHKTDGPKLYGAWIGALKQR